MWADFLRAGSGKGARERERGVKSGGAKRKFTRKLPRDCCEPLVKRCWK